MQTLRAVPAVPPLPAGLEPLSAPKKRWPAWLGGALTVAMMLGLAQALLSGGVAGLKQDLPDHPGFWLCFAGYYLAQPVGDWLIFRRLWGIPASGLVALTRKRIANDLIVSYTGEAYFYSWARARAKFVAAPFGAIKDVSILSAIAGNVLTLVMLAIALPLGRGLLTPEQYRAALWSTAVLLFVSLPFLFFSRRVFSLPRRQLGEVFALHCTRVVASTGFTALAWAFALPGVPVGIWLFLAAGRLLVSRLPLLSTTQKDVAFFTVAALFVGEHAAIGLLIAIFTALTIATNGALFLLFALGGLVAKGRAW